MASNRHSLYNEVVEVVNQIGFWSHQYHYWVVGINKAGCGLVPEDELKPLKK